MRKVINREEFVQAFNQCDREEQFSRTAREALFEYLEDLEEDIGEKIELDVIALCCEWSEETPGEIFDNYGIGDFEELRDNTTAIKLCNGNILYQQF